MYLSQFEIIGKTPKPSQEKFTLLLKTVSKSMVDKWQIIVWRDAISQGLVDSGKGRRQV